MLTQGAALAHQWVKKILGKKMSASKVEVHAIDQQNNMIWLYSLIRFSLWQAKFKMEYRGTIAC